MTVTAEIAGQIDTALLCMCIAAVGLIFFQEQRGIGQTEPVYALFDIADHKPVVRTGYQPGNHFLNAIRILIFIHEDFLECLPQFLCGIGPNDVFRRRRRVQEYVQAEVFQVVEIDPAFFSLCLSVRISKIFCQLHQSCNIRFHTSQSIQPFPFRWHKPHIFHVRKLFLA